MTSTIRHVFGLLGAVMLSLLLWAWFISSQPTMYRAFNVAIVQQWDLASANNGRRASATVDKVWGDTVTSNPTANTWGGVHEEEIF